MIVFPKSNSKERSQHSIIPPVAKKIESKTDLHGEIRLDNYAWLKEKQNSETIEYLNRENEYTNKITQQNKQFEEDLYKEMLGRIKETDMTVPTKRDSYFYYSRTEEGKQYRFFCRKYQTLDATEEIILDENVLAEGKEYFDIGVFNISDNHSFVAYAVDETGYRQYKLYIKNIEIGEIIDESVGFVVSFQWAPDNQTFFYTTEDEAKRAYRLYRRTLGKSQGVLVYEEKDPLYSVSISRSRDRAYHFLTIGSKDTREVHYIKSQFPNDDFKVILPREKEHKYSVEHRSGLFYFLTNKEAKNYRVVTSEVAHPQEEHWKELVPQRDHAMIEDVDLFANHCVLTIRDSGLVQFEVIDFESSEVKRINFPEPTYSVYGGANPEFESQTFRYNYQSLVSPSSVYDYDTRTGISILLKQQEVLGEYNPNDFVSERVFAIAQDGIQIPISLVYKKELKQNKPQPAYLNGYGSYGIPNDASFSSSRLALLDRGVIFAIAHVRGGGEMGDPWHDAGKMKNKMNTFTDFIACAEFLFSNGYTSPEHLAISGGSAGGLLIGAVINLRPDLCRVAHLAVPFVDVVNTMLDESLPLTIGEFLEWGNPKVKDEFDVINSYCPYTNLGSKNYPNILITTSLNDSQVGYWEPAKYTAKLRTLKRDQNLLLLKINMDAGHGGASGRYDYLKELAFEYAVILWLLDLNH